ncbi:hypothetical protein TNIN_418661 [Trichonephila inaurata madagascariensis]|uniref:Uncharacterized protein n=1 Tax=Trichonephila inaurata madagascariensis TaxID=2747483 RepID=A0A8X6IUU0_9ARAC|nr:hypothetical protein TNIN_418661 [Trichonephila inaurata madagascariensis]
MSSGLDAELFPASGVCPVSECQNSFQCQGNFHWPGGRTLPASGVCSVPWRQKFVKCQGIECPGGRTLSSVRGISSVRVAELCASSGICPVAWRQNSVLRQWCLVSEWQNSVHHQGYFQCPEGKTLPCVRSMSNEMKPELCPASGVCPVAWRQNSVQGQGTLSLVRGMSSGLVVELSCVIGMFSVWGAELGPASGVCPVSRRQNCPRVRGMSNVQVAKICPESGVCRVA